ncbi:MAG: carboxypeptidase [Bacteroidota bacterium]|nr:carboxypeptidase [Bacteroidota bacterium]
MRKIILLFVFQGILLIAKAQGINDAKSKDSASAIVKEGKSGSLDIVFKPEEKVITTHSVTIRGKQIPYTATAGTLPVWNNEGKCIAGLFYAYYERSDVANRSARPLVFFFNGGPGSSSAWMHIGYAGPKILNIDADGYPVYPAGVKENPYSVLDVADIVFVDPVNTGYSRSVINDAGGNEFFNVQSDIRYLSSWIGHFLTRNSRWASPVFLVGESYGTTRVSGIAAELQKSEWIYVSGVVLVSPTELGIERKGPVQEALKMPYFTAAAWYHSKLSPALQHKDLEEVLAESEKFTTDELLPAIVRGASLTGENRKRIAEKMSRYSGMASTVILQNNLDISSEFFWKELLRDRGYTIGRLDSRYLGIDKKDAGESVDYNAELSTWYHAFTPPINMYLRDELQYKTDLQYVVLKGIGFQGSSAGIADNLRLAMAQDPSLKVMIQSGYYDGACDYFNAKYSMWQIDPGGKFKDRFSFKGYRSGHMVYLRKEDLIAASEDLRSFILSSVPKAGVSIKY